MELLHCNVSDPNITATAYSSFYGRLYSCKDEHGDNAWTTQYVLSESLPLTPAQIMQPWGAGFTVGAIPIIMGLAVASVLRFVRR
jgi:hypothetical protein